MVGHDVMVVQELLREQPQRYRASCEDAAHPQCSEEVQRTGKIAQQEADRDQVEEYAEGPRYSVMRNPALTVDVADRYFADGSAVPRRQCWNEPVQLAVEGNLLQDVAAVSLECRSKVVN